MGFRGDPLTTATGVDTGESLTGPGARLYQDTTSAYPRGVLEFRTGLGDAPAGMDTTAYVFDDGTGVLRSAGSTTLVRGAASQTAAAGIRLDEEENPAGGYRSVVEFRGDVVRTPKTIQRTGARDVVVPASAFKAGWSPWDSAGFQNLTITRLPTGMITVEGLARWTPTAVGASALITTVSGNFLPRGGNVILDGLANDDGRLYSIAFLTNGEVRVRGTLPAAGFLRISGDYRGAEF